MLHIVRNPIESSTRLNSTIPQMCSSSPNANTPRRAPRDLSYGNNNTEWEYMYVWEHLKKNSSINCIFSKCACSDVCVMNVGNVQRPCSSYSPHSITQLPFDSRRNRLFRFSQYRVFFQKESNLCVGLLAVLICIYR